MIADLIGTLPPLAKLVAVVVPLWVFVSWGPWAWVLGGAAAIVALGPAGPDVAVLLGYLLGGLGYVLYCRWNPMDDCRWCKGSPKRRGSRGFHWCFWCGGNGRRTKLGAYAWSKHRESGD